LWVCGAMLLVRPCAAAWFRRVRCGACMNAGHTEDHLTSAPLIHPWDFMAWTTRLWVCDAMLLVRPCTATWFRRVRCGACMNVGHTEDHLTSAPLIHPWDSFALLRDLDASTPRSRGAH
jgi:ribosomal protein S27E